jgi:predicted amidohydrolase
MRVVLVQPHLEYGPDADNHRVIHELCEPLRGTLAEDDVLLLPEHFDLRPSRAEYEGGLRDLSRYLSCHVVGGTHHEDRGDHHVNSGIIVDRAGARVAVYEKLRPYAEERTRVRPGTVLGEAMIGGHAVLVLVCADFWFSDLFYRAQRAPDLILVPAFSVSRKATPDYSRALWRHLSVARAYEFGAYVGVSDWAHAPSPWGASPSGVSGFADPTQIEPTSLHRALDGSVQVFDVDFARLADLRRDRVTRGFFWKSDSA